MRDNIIEFLYPKGTKKLFEDNLPEPTSLNIPKWFKELKHTRQLRTVKGCIPFLETLTAGYILKTPQELHLEFNVKNENDQQDIFTRYAYQDNSHDIQRLFLNLNSKESQSHPPEQLGPECPFHSKNKNLPFIKILNPFAIRTPPGYSCLFVPPLNNCDDRFSIISGIVDTDSFNEEINFPIIINGDKYPTLDTVVKIGTPYVQIIPFKRDNWKMQVNELKSNKIIDRLSMLKTFLHNYKTYFWSKKKWK